MSEYDSREKATSFCDRGSYRLRAATRYGSHTWLALAAQALGELAVAQGHTGAALACYVAARNAFQEASNDQAAGQCVNGSAQLRQQ